MLLAHLSTQLNSYKPRDLVPTYKDITTLGNRWWRLVALLLCLLETGTSHKGKGVLNLSLLSSKLWLLPSTQVRVLMNGLQILPLKAGMGLTAQHLPRTVLSTVTGTTLPTMGDNH